LRFLDLRILQDLKDAKRVTTNGQKIKNGSNQSIRSFISLCYY
jgi:hypothetical protein